MAAARHGGYGPIAQRPGSRTAPFSTPYHYFADDDFDPSAASPALAGMHTLSPRRRAAQAAGMNGYNASTDLPPPLFVRALYNYEADDPTSLSFRQGDIIQVLTQLESGWWDGLLDNRRGWFPSNYCGTLDPDDTQDSSEHEGDTSGAESEEVGEEYDDDLDARTHDEDTALPLEGARSARSHNPDEAAFWIPQATPDGRLFYFNTRTGVSAMDLPLETPLTSQEVIPASDFHFPTQTRPPPEMMAGGYLDEEDYDGSSELDNERSTAYMRQTRYSSIGAPTAPANRTRVNNGLPIQTLQYAPNGTTATSFSVPVTGHVPRSSAPRHFSDDVGAPTPTWESLVENMRTSIDEFRAVIRRNERSEYVRRAEDISDHLRILLAAGSGTTDNHSGNPSIISANKALYPHFREMMSKFSKLVLSSHIAAADWPGPDSGSKCLQEADGVMHGVYGYVEVARQQRGEDIPRLLPGFVVGSLNAGNWQDNNIDNQVMVGNHSFIDPSDDEGRSKPSTPLDKLSLQRAEQARGALSASIRRLEDQLQYTEKLITPGRQMEIGDNICLSAGALIEQFRPWITQIEALDLAPIGNTFQKPSLVDFSSHKQKVYDSIGELVTACQATTAPLPDEWAEVRGESLETRLNAIRAVCKQLESHVAQVNYSLQLLEPTINPAPTGMSGNKKDHRLTDPGDLLHNGARNNLPSRPRLEEIPQSRSYTLGQDGSLEFKARKPSKDKAQQFFGAVPPILNDENEMSFNVDERPWFLQLDHETELHLDTKVDPPIVKSGTLAGLVEWLTRHDRSDLGYIKTFLLTYRSFISAAELFQFLVKRFNIQPPSGLSREELLLWEEQKQRNIRHRVMNVFKIWMETYWMEANDPESQMLLERMNAFTRNSLVAKMSSAPGLAAAIEQRIKGQDPAKKLILTLTTNAPAPIVPKNLKKLKFLELDPLEFARQLTIAEAKLYGRIKPVECLEKIWEKRDKDGDSDRAGNVRALILHSNQMTNWVAEMILNHTEVKKRVHVIRHFVAIADKCRLLNNFSSLTAIVSALGTAPILRLNRTWAQVPAKSKDVLESMRSLIASTKNFMRYREALHQAQPPCIPFLGVYLTDLTFIEDGIASMVKNTELINFTKRSKTADVIRDIQTYQDVPYALQEVNELRDWILDNMRAAPDVHDMYNKSLAIEPREREEEKIARLLSESGFL